MGFQRTHFLNSSTESLVPVSVNASSFSSIYSNSFYHNLVFIRGTDVKKLLKIDERGTLNASRALSKLIDRPVSVKILKAEVKKVEELGSIIGPEENVVGIYLPITGNVLGAALLIFPKETALTLCDLLAKREPGKTRKLTKSDESALKDVGTIISAHYVTVLSNMLQVNITEHMPNFSLDIFRLLIGQIMKKFARDTEKALILEIELILKSIRLRGYFLFLFEREDSHEILDSLDG